MHHQRHLYSILLFVQLEIKKELQIIIGCNQAHFIFISMLLEIIDYTRYECDNIFSAARVGYISDVKSAR